MYAHIIVSVVATGSNALEYQLLAGVRDGFHPGDAALAASDVQQAWVARLELAVWLSTSVLVLLWIRRANHNVRQLGARGLRFSPAGSIGWYFVPIVSLWKPYQAMKEIWRASLDPENWPDMPVPVLLPVWWALWLVSNSLGFTELRLSNELFDNPGVSDFIAANIVSQASTVSGILPATVLLAIINRVYRMQVEHRRAAPLVESVSGALDPDTVDRAS